MGSHEIRIEGQNRLPCHAQHAALAAAQNMVDPLGCKCRLLVHAEFLIYQQAQVHLCRSALSPFIILTLSKFGIDLAQVRDLTPGYIVATLSFVKLTLALVKVPLDGIPSF